MTLISNRNLSPFLFAIILWFALVFPPLAQILEARLVSHLLVQLPALALVGWIIVRAIMRSTARENPEWNEGGIAALLIALITITFWMIPRFLDESLASPTMAIAKYTTIPILVGGALAFGWDHVPAFLKGYVKANFLSMLLFLSWLYRAAPVQLCNNYLIGDQLALSGYIFSIFLILCVGFSCKPLFGISLSRPFYDVRRSVTWLTG